MNWRSVIHLCAISLLIFCYSCEREIELNLPDAQKLVAISNFTVDKPLNVFLSATNPISEFTFKYPEDAIVQFYEDDVFLENLLFQDNSTIDKPSFYYTDTELSTGSQYKIRVAYDSYPTIEAQGTIPEPTPIAQWNLLRLELNTNNNIPYLDAYNLKSKVSFSNSTTTNKYFHLIAWRNVLNYEVFGTDTIIFNSYQEPVPLSTEVGFPFTEIVHDPGILIDRTTLMEEEGAIRLNFTISHDPVFELRTPIYLALRNVSADYYLFHKSVSEQEVSNFRESILSADPVMIHNNIEGGFGNFSAYNEVIDSLFW